MEEKKAVIINDFFKTEEHKIIFAVLYTDTLLREKHFTLLYFSIIPFSKKTD